VIGGFAVGIPMLILGAGILYSESNRREKEMIEMLGSSGGVSDVSRDGASEKPTHTRQMHPPERDHLSKYCRYCGQVIHGDSVFCEYCGKRL